MRWPIAVKKSPHSTAAIRENARPLPHVRLIGPVWADAKVREINMNVHEVRGHYFLLETLSACPFISYLLSYFVTSTAFPGRYR